MKFLTLVAVGLISLNAMAQNASMAYNPDSNGDDLIGATDLISLLGLYGTMMIDASNTCDYEGTELEQLITGLLSEDLVLDSMYVEYSLIDTQQTFLPGCPEPILVDLVLERSHMLTNVFTEENGEYFGIFANTNVLGFNREIQLIFSSTSGSYRMVAYDAEVSALGAYGAYSDWNGGGPLCCESWVTLPFPESWTLNENGIQVTWDLGWVSHCQHIRLIPYWHAAE